MFGEKNRAVDTALVEEATQTLLKDLGSARMLSVSYDTSWMARLSVHYPKSGFDDALNWLRRHQHPEGSWGSEILHYHDRTISTLAAIIALHYASSSPHAHPEDEARIAAGQSFLWRNNGRLHHDANDTVAFPLLAVALSTQANDMNLSVPRDLYKLIPAVERKLKLLSNDPRQWRRTTISFSLEGAISALSNMDDVIEANGSVSASPSATAAVLLSSDVPHSESLRYLQQAVTNQNDGGASFASPFELFEITWSLNSLRLAGAISPDNPEVKRALNIVWDAWQPDRGIAFSSFFSVPDLDCTSEGFAALHWGGYPVETDAFVGYEQAEHFQCYPAEVDPSLSAHVRMLSALRLTNSNEERVLRWMDKVIQVMQRYDRDGYFWFDKWHTSPYYLTSIAVRALYGICNYLVRPRIEWIRRTQQQNGGWGYYGMTTAEETAYCLSSLLFWDQNVERVDPAQLDAAASYLSAHVCDTTHTPLWIAKSLYTPVNVVNAAVLAALHEYIVYKNL
jgi:halimadienyl-diphosphate synthase